MSKECLISVIVPVYNVAGYLDACISSILSQTYQNLEILLVDDGSIDSSGKICDRYAEKDSRIMIYHKENGGLSDARNYALDRARGELIAFVDGDDWIHPQMYEVMQSVMEDTRSDLVTCGFERENRNFAYNGINIGLSDVRLLTREDAISNIEIPLVVAWNKLYRRCIFDGIRFPVGRVHEDEFIIHRILWKCRRISVINRALYFYTERDGSIITKMTPKRIYDALEAFEDRILFTDSEKWMEALPVALKRYCDYTIDRYYEIKNGVYAELDNSFLELLWERERKMLEKYRNISICKKYRKFAKSPETYERWLRNQRMVEKYKNRIRAAFKKWRSLSWKK